MTTLRFPTIWDEAVSRTAPSKAPSTTERFVSIWDRPTARRAAAEERKRPARRLPKFYI